MNIKLILIVLYFIFNNDFINSYIIKDITPSPLNTAYLTAGTECKFSFYLFCTTTQIGEQCNTLSYSVPLSEAPNVLSNDTSSITHASWSIPVGTTTVTVNLVYTFNITCLAISVDDISFKLYKGPFVIPNLSKKSFNYGAIYELQGLDNVTPASIGVGSLNNTLYSFSYCGGINKFLLITQDLTSTSDISSSVSLDIFIQSDTKTFTFETLFKDTYDQIYDIKSYPSSEYLSSLQLLGVGEAPVISFKVNSTIFKSNLVITANNSTDITCVFPIYGDQFSTTYLYSMSVFNSDIVYDLYYQSGKTLKKSTQSIKEFTHAKSFISLMDSTGTFNPISNAYPNFDNFIEYKYVDNRKYLASPIKIIRNGGTLSIKDYPFGYSSVSKNGYQFSYCFPSKSIVYTPNQIGIVSAFDNTGSYYTQSAINYENSKLPVITFIKGYHLKDNLYIYRVQVNTPYGYLSMETYDNRVFGYESNISGNLTSGTYEVVHSVTFNLYFLVNDIYGGADMASSNFVALFPEPLVFSAPQTKYFDVFSISNVSFLYNDLDVTNRRHYNVLYFNYTSEQVARDVIFSMTPSDASNLNPLSNIDSIFKLKFFYSTYDRDLQLFKIEFYVDANIEYGDYSFAIVVNGVTLYSASLDNQLRIKKTNTDLQGPLISSISKVSLANDLSPTNSIALVGWKVVISDSINGFDYGYFKIKGIDDYSVYNITINSNDVKEGGDIYLGEYDILFTIEYPCFSTDYLIEEVLLVDRVGKISFFSTLPQNRNVVGAANPFLNVLESSDLRIYSVSCVEFSDTSPPVLTSFSSSLNTIDVGKSNRQVTFNFTAQDPQSGLKNYQYPIVYLATPHNQLLECKSIIVSIDKINAAYSCTIELPLGYAYPYQIMLSVYGFINGVGLGSGYSTSELSLISTAPAHIITTFDQTINEPVVKSHYLISERGGDLLLFGKGFISDSTFAYITFYDGSISVIKASTIYPTSIIIPNVKATSKPYQLYVKVNSMLSNNLTVTPTVYDYFINTGPLEPTLTPAPTNSPQLCQGNPVCGGPSNGKCLSTGCVCYSPWVGIDCLSQIIIIDQPKANETSPSTSIEIPANNNSSSTVSYKSLITLVSIRELNILGEEVYSKEFEKWQVTTLQSDNTTFIYNATLNIDKNNQVSTTTIKATLKWFTQETNITFADEQLLMNPSTMKYTIEIGNYPFDSALNQLQLVMSASIQSNSNDSSICSVRQYGETTSGDNSNYLKIQVDNHSLYGRFIRRGIVDSTITKITNVLLDKDMNPITSNNQLQSYIGIQIPNYKYNVFIDPDFSILIDSNSASSKKGSICSNKSKLSASKIAGIVIGCVAFVAVVITMVSYYIIKKKRNTKFIQNINNKMKQMNNDKL